SASVVSLGRSSGTQCPVSFSTTTVTSVATSLVCCPSASPNDFSPPMSVLACAAWSERVARNPWLLVGTKRNRPIPHACVPDVRKPPCRLCDLLPESNESCRLLSHSRNTRSRYARDLEPGLRRSEERRVGKEWRTR